MQISFICQRTAIQYSIQFPGGTEFAQAKSGSLGLHPLFALPIETSRYLLQQLVDNYELRNLQPESFLKTLLVAHLCQTKLIQFRQPIDLGHITVEATELYGTRILAIVDWIDGFGNYSDLPHFAVNSESRGNLIPGFLKELELFRDIGQAKRNARDLSLQFQALDIQNSRREMYGLKAITPGVARQVCKLISWTLDNEDIALNFLLADSNRLLAMLNREDLYLQDLATLLYDVEVLDWQSSMKTTIVDHLRGIVNIIHSIRGMSAAEKELFTDTIIGHSGFMDVLADNRNSVEVISDSGKQPGVIADRLRITRPDSAPTPWAKNLPIPNPISTAVHFSPGHSAEELRIMAAKPMSQIIAERKAAIAAAKV